ncbi:DUF6968 family protein [Streptomyces sp. NPDC051704]|uniref:DUF6968 family protein n=1 Tax=Streptomyces sp. NPDC051704 TaxID=3365671 RepID=UPI0037A0F317
MKNNPVIASRRLEAVTREGETFPVTLQLGAPYPDPDPAGDWICPCRLEGLSETTYEIHGVDGIQALALAAEVLGSGLTEAAQERGLTFTWGGESGLTAAEVLLHSNTAGR